MQAAPVHVRGRARRAGGHASREVETVQAAVRRQTELQSNRRARAITVATASRVASAPRSRAVRRSPRAQDADRGRDADRVALEEAASVGVAQRGERQGEELLVGHDDQPLLEVRRDRRDQ